MPQENQVSISEDKIFVQLKENDWTGFKHAVLSSGDYKININDDGEEGEIEEIRGDTIIYRIDKLRIRHYPGRGQRYRDNDTFRQLYFDLVRKLDDLREARKHLSILLGNDCKVIKNTDTAIASLEGAIHRTLVRVKDTEPSEPSDNEEEEALINEEGDWEEDVDGEC